MCDFELCGANSGNINGGPCLTTDEEHESKEWFTAADNVLSWFICAVLKAVEHGANHISFETSKE